MRAPAFLLLGVLSSLFVSGQTIKRCATAESMNEYRALHPDAETDQQFETWLQQKTQERITSNQRVTVAYTIPIIFHIIHNGEAVGTGRNISASKIASQLAQVNADYANLSGSTYGVAVNTEIQFCLAVQRPDGTVLPEPGIERIDRNTMGWNAPPYAGTSSTSYVDVTIMPQSIWDPNRFFNVWVLELSGGLLGKATFPTGSTLSGLGSGDTDTHSGVFVDYRSVGSVSDPGPNGATYGLGRTLTHEGGHFFGLRHIWGDGTCATDYCADTPPQDQETIGCPTQPAANNCAPAGNKMFENYMDYTDDGCVNTLTNDQKTRMQTVMANSPRRGTLQTSGACTVPASNSIRFTALLQSATETVVGACPRTKDIVLTLHVSSVATGNATVTFTKAGTATDVADYTVIPASVSYTNGDNADKAVTIRINDDGAVEGPETIVIGFSISGSGVVNGTGVLTHTITLTSDDFVTVIDNSPSVTVFTENFEGASVANWSTGSFTGAGVNQWTVSANGGSGISGLSAHITNDLATNPLNYNVGSASDVVLITPLIDLSSYTDAVVSFTYKCDGELQGATYRDYGRITYTLNGNTFISITDGVNPIRYQGVTTATTTNVVIPAAVNHTSFALGWRWTNNATLGSNPPFVFDDVVVTAAATRIESTASEPASESIFSGQDVYLKSATDGQLLARIQNPNADLGCITATISQAGNGTTSITTASGTYLRSNKVIGLTASPANTSATYTATFYFTTAELAAWGSLTGLQLLKVNDGVNLTSTTITPQNGQLVAATIDDQRVAKGYASFTGSFSGGFSQFIIVSSTTTLPVELLSFEAKGMDKKIVLNWSTSQEINNKGFGIERSKDGVNFESIGWMDGRINSDSRADYVYNDHYVQPGIVYYYRLRQTDIDNHQKLSEVRQAKINKGLISVVITPNPASGQVNLFISGSSSLANVRLFDMQGQLVRRWDRVNASANVLTLSVSGLASGLYMLHVELPEQKLVERLLVK